MLLSREELDKSAVPHPAVVEFASKVPPRGVPDYKVTRQALKAMAGVIMERIGPAPPGTQELYHDITLSDGFSSSLKIHKPSEPKAGPLIVLLFGGGFIVGDNDQSTPMARALVKLFDATVVNISYRVAPEHKFPQAALDSIDSVKWIAENATGSLLTADPTKAFLLGGSSSGACIASCLSRKFQEEKLAFPLTGQWLNIPPLMTKESCPRKYQHLYISREANAAAFGLTKPSLDMMVQTSQWDEGHELGCAAVSKTPISGQPQTYLQVCGMDMLRDDGLIYEEMLKEAGVSTKLDFYPGCPHGHCLMMDGLPLANEANTDAVKGIAWLLGTSISDEEAASSLGIHSA